MSLTRAAPALQRAASAPSRIRRIEPQIPQISQISQVRTVTIRGTGARWGYADLRLSANLRNLRLVVGSCGIDGSSADLRNLRNLRFVVGSCGIGGSSVDLRNRGSPGPPRLRNGRLVRDGGPETGDPATAEDEP